ncbi:hypothetical protein AOLI_G00104180 [Acnodon oligacanthus]
MLHYDNYAQVPCSGKQCKSTKGICCFSFYTRPIPVAVIKEYEETRHDCTRAGVIFTIKNGLRVCTDPGFKWVNRAMDTIDRRILEGSTSAK